MNLYLEPSGLAKPYLGEADAYLVRAAVEAADVVGTSVLSLAEVMSSVFRAQRSGTITGDQAASIAEVFTQDWVHYFRIAVQDETVVLASSLIQKWPLRGFDAVHLASALSWQTMTGEGVVFMSFDRQLRTAADGERLWLLPEGHQLS
ncbi:MAG: type II toxin-antitoxin system VapC family toxin [Tepidiformaceae bacterium]